MRCARGLTKLSVVVLLCGVAPGLWAQKTFDEYFKMVKAQKIGDREAAFMKECGLSPDDTTPIYGVRLGAIKAEKWSPRNLLGIGIKEGFNDYYTAEIRAVDAKPRMISTWWITLQTGESQNAMYCLGDNGKVKSVVTLNIYDPPGAAGSGTRYLRRQAVTPSGHVTEDHGTFVNEENTPVDTPKLNKQDLNAAQAPGLPVVAYEAIRDLWGKKTGPIVVPYEQPQSTTQKSTTPKR